MNRQQGRAVILTLIDALWENDSWAFKEGEDQ